MVAMLLVGAEGKLVGTSMFTIDEKSSSSVISTRAAPPILAAPLRILMFSIYLPPQYSGAAKQALSLAHHLRERGHRVEFVTVRWPGLAEEETIEGFRVHRVEAGRSAKHRELRLWWNLVRYAWERRKDFDVLHSHGAYYTNSVVGPVAKALGWKSVVKASLTDNDLHGIGGSFAGCVHYVFLRLVDACVAISEDLREEFLSAGIPLQRVFHLPNGVDTDRFRPAGAQEKQLLRQSLALPVERQIALAVGVFDERKNIGWLMTEWIRRGAFGSNIFLVAVGPQSRDDVDGGFLQALRELANAHPDSLRLVNEVKEIERYYQAADLFILPSQSEGMPNVILEAMACGLPCVASRVSGTRDLVRDGETGHTFLPRDPVGLSQALTETLQGNMAVLGRRARQMVTEGYGLGTLAERYERLYCETRACKGTRETNAV